MPQFFGAVDKDKLTGKVTSEYPAWYFERRIERLKESIEESQKELESGVLPADQAIELRERVKKETAKLREIHESKPKLTDKEKDELKEIYDTLDESIGETMFTRSEMMKKLADPYKEYKRNVEACIKGNKNIIEFAKENGIPVEKGGYLNRNNASRIYKIAGKYLGLETNTEYLRKDQ